MAVTLSVELTDDEQARLTSIAAQVAPNLTPQQLKTWAETQAKEGLRRKVVEVWADHQREAANTAVREAEANLQGSW